MKILGEKSLSSKVEKGLKILFLIILLVEIGAFLLCSFTLFFEYTSSSMIKNYMPKIILLTILSVIFLMTGIFALYIIYQFIKIFNNLKESKLFERDNINCLKLIWVLSLVMGGLYLICLIVVGIVLNKYVPFNSLSMILIEILILTFAIVFLVFGIGIRILNEIYLKAIEYKEENDVVI